MFSDQNIGGFAENCRRLASFEGQLTLSRVASENYIEGWGGGAIILQLGDFMNDTFGPNSEKGAMWYQNLVHLWPYKKNKSRDVRSHDF